MHQSLVSLLAVAAGLSVAIAALAASSQAPVEADSTFNPTTTVRLCNAMPASFPDPELAGDPACVENTALNSSGPVTVGINVPASDVNFSRVVTLSPNASTIAPGTSMPAGTKLGGLRTLTTFGLMGGLCNFPFTLDFVLYNVALPNNPGDPRASTNLVYPRAVGQPDRFGRWELAPGGTDPTDNVEDDTPMDMRADGDTLSIQNYPAYLLDAFDPDFVTGGGDGPLPPLVPKAVYGGLVGVLGQWIPLYFTQFDAGALTVMPGAQSLMTSQMGQPSVSVLGDPTAGGAVGPSSQVTDICTPTNLTVVLLGQDPTSTYTRSTGPSTAGTQFVVQHLASQRDLDQDGYENTVDTCPRNPDVGSPKTGSGDTDSDRIDDACDPTVSALGDFDEDNDGIENRSDTCPLDISVAGEAETTAPPANDLGPDGDFLGDACDSGAVSATVNGRPVTFTLSTTVGNGRYHTRTNYVAKCFGGTDADGDGYCTTQEGGQDGNAVRHQPWGGAFTTSQSLLQMDTDGDGWSDAAETYLGTDATKACQQSPEWPVISGGANNEGPLDNWPIDYNDDQVPSTVDIGTFLSRLGLSVDQPPAAPRWDLDFNGGVSSVDIGKFVTVLNRRCDRPLPAGMGHPTYSSQTQ